MEILCEPAFHNVSSSILTNLLNVFSHEVLLDFQDLLSDIFKLPSSLWLYDITGGLKHLQPRVQHKYYPPFCSYLHTLKAPSDSTSYCTMQDSIRMRHFIHDILANSAHDHYHLVQCHMGLTRIVFPLKLTDTVICALVLGKFKMSDIDNDVLIENSVHSYFERHNIDTIFPHGTLSECRDKLLTLIANIPIVEGNDLDAIYVRTLQLLPFLKSLYVHLRPNDPIYDGIIFLESLDYADSSVFLTYDAFWSRVRHLMNMIVDKVHLRSGIVLFNNRDNYQKLLTQVIVPSGQHAVESISLSDDQELHTLTTSDRGFIIPAAQGPLSWLNDFCQPIFGTDAAIIYARHVFAGKLVVIGFGFNPDIRLTRFERFILKDSVVKLFNFINTALSRIELDHMMAETGHMLGRAAGDLKHGVDVLHKYGHTEHESDPIDIIDARKSARHSIESGLLRLDLIIRNYHAFSEIRDVSGDFSNELSNLTRVDIYTLLKKYEFLYEKDLQVESKHFKYDPANVPVCIVYGRLQILDLLFYNLIDNAVKFSYNGTYVHIIIREQDNHYHISITNLGVGVAADEYQSVFERYIQSRFVDKIKRREGTGYGLAICRRYVETFFPSGSIALSSRPAHMPRVRGFRGDNYLTTVTVVLPIPDKE